MTDNINDYMNCRTEQTAEIMVEMMIELMAEANRIEKQERYALVQCALGNVNIGMARYAAVQDTYHAILNGDYDD